MQLICGIITTIWNKIYNTIFASLDEETKTKVGVGILIFALLMMSWSLKSPKKTQVVGSWFLFWIAVISLIVSILYFVY